MDPTTTDPATSTPATATAVPEEAPPMNNTDGGAKKRTTPLANRSCKHSNQERLASGRCGVKRGPNGTPKKRTTPMSQRSVTRRRSPAGAAPAESTKRAIEKLAAEVREMRESFDKTVQYIYEDMENEIKSLEQRLTGSSSSRSSSSSKKKRKSAESDDDSSDDGMGDWVKQYNAAIAAKNAAEKK